MTVSDKGTGQGSVRYHRLLANIYLHYSLDLWAQRWRRREATGGIDHRAHTPTMLSSGSSMRVTPGASGTQCADGCRSFRAVAASGEGELAWLSLDRRAAANRRQRGLGKPETFDFLGMTFICGTSLRGKIPPQAEVPERSGMKAKLKEVGGELRQRMHQAIPEQGAWLKQVVTGYFAYHAVPTNWAALNAFRAEIILTLAARCTPGRRSEKGGPSTGIG